MNDETRWLVRGWQWFLDHPHYPNRNLYFAAWFARFAKHEQTHPGAFAEAAREVTW
jgi:hypothetical protein